MIATAPRLPASKTSTTMIVWLSLAFAVTGVNLLNQASFDFSLLTGLFVLTVWAAVSACGGLGTFFGATMAYIGFQHVVFASFAKFFLGQPIEARLDVPITTMEIYCLGMTSMAAGGWVASQVIRRYKRVLFPTIEDPKMLRAMAWSALGLTFVRILAMRARGSDLNSGGASNAGFIAVIIAAEYLPLLAVACATGARVIESNRTKCIDWLVLLALAPTVLSGLASAGRGEMVFALGACLFSAMAFGFQFRLVHYVSMAVVGVIAVYIVFPYGRYARQYVRGADMTANAVKAAAILEDVIADPMKYQSQASSDPKSYIGVRSESNLHRHWQFYVPHNETLSRFSNIKMTDMLVFNAGKHDPLGWKTTIDGLEMATPSTFLEEKPLLGDSNMLVRMVPQYLGPKDFVTQPNTGVFADTYLSFRWLGVAFYPAALVFFYSITYGYLVKLKFANNVYAIGLVMPMAATLSEGTVAFQIVSFSLHAIYAGIMLGAVWLIASIMDQRSFPQMRAREKAAQRRISEGLEV